VTAIPLDDFFAQMEALLANRIDAATCEQVLGRSPSGTERFGLYVKLVDRQQQAALTGLFRATLVAAATWDRARSDELRAGFLRAHPPAHWSPTACVAPFADYLEHHGAPADVIELADFARTRHDVLRAPAGDAAGLAVRHYVHAVHEFTVAVERGEIDAGRPRPCPSTWLFGRDQISTRLVMVRPSVPLLVALYSLEHGAPAEGMPAVEPDDLARAVEFLDEQRLLSASALDRLRART